MGPPAATQRSGRRGERRHSGGNELCRLRRSERSVTCADDVGRDDLGAPSTCRGCPPGAPARRAHRFLCQKRWENHQGLRFLRWLRVDFHRRRPRRLRPWIRGPWRRWAVIGWKEPGRHRRPPHWLALAVTGAPAEAQRSTRKGHAASVRRQSRQRLRSGFGGERRPSGGNELSGLPGSERSVAWADDAAPRAARIGITRQALTAAALYRLGPPGRRRCHASEIPGQLRRLSVGRDDLGAPFGLPPAGGKVPQCAHWGG